MGFHFLHPVTQPERPAVTYVTIACTGWFDEDDDSLVRGSHTAYEIECTVQGPDGGVLQFRDAHRRFREWRKLHLALYPKSKFPEPKAISHDEALKAKRAEALENWLTVAFAQSTREDGSPPIALLQFVGMTEWPATGTVGLIALPRPTSTLALPSGQTAATETQPHPVQKVGSGSSRLQATLQAAPIKKW